VTDLDEPASAAPKPKRTAARRKTSPTAAKADDLDAIKKAVEDAATVSGALWFSYLFVLFYFAIAAGAVTHADLFLENPVKLPFLGVDLPLLAFFFLAPILFVIVHAYILVHLVMLTDKAKRYHQALHQQIEDDAIRDGLRRQLPGNVFVQFLAGAPETREGPFGWILRAIGWTTLVIGPVLLLLLIQIQFLPFHNSFVTWTHRLALLADLLLIWWLWRRILSGREVDGPRNWWTAMATFTAFGLSVGVCLFSVLTAYFPGELQEGRPTRLARSESGFSLNELIFNSPIDDATRRRRLPFSNTLVLTSFNIYEGLKIDDPDKAKWHDFVFRARGRDLNGAIFDLALLPKIDFQGARLKGASLEGAQLQGSSLDNADLEDALLAQAQLQGASLDHANLRSAFFPFAQLQGASLYHAQLQGAHGDQAQLQGASLDFAELQGAQLTDEELQGASLDYAQIQGASLDNTQLQGASLAGAQLQGTSLGKAHLEATDLSNSLLWRTNSAGERFPLIEVPKVTAVIFPDAPETWSPSWRDEMEKVQPWNEEAYLDLRVMMEALPPPGMTEMMRTFSAKGWSRRDTALRRIRSLDCIHPEKTLASCNPSIAPPPEAAAWRKSLEGGRVNEAAYAKALAAKLKTLVCSGDANAPYILHGLLVAGPFKEPLRLQATGSEAPGLIDIMMSKDCPVSASLTNDDKARLLRVRWEAIEKAKAAQLSVKTEAPPLP
jgi:uncharacterized protein YjbI with pentapeptide repeats